MKSLLREYLAATAAAELAASYHSSSPRIDRALAAELEAEDALRLHVKLAAGVHPGRPVDRPVAAYLDGSLVVVATSNDDPDIEHLHVIEPRDIARSG